MKLNWRSLVPCAALALAGVGGCQTHVMEASMTLPSGHYLRHQPQYIPPTPPYPLSRELANLTAASVGVPPAAPPGPPIQ